MHSDGSAHNENVEQLATPCHHVCPPPTIVNIQEINLRNVDSDLNLHLGAQLTLNGPVIIRGITKQDVLSIMETCCHCRKLEQEKHTKGEKNQERKSKLKKECLNLCSVNKFLSVVLLIVIVQVVLLAFFAKPNIPRSNGICVQEVYDMYLKKKITRRRNWGFDSNCTYDEYLKNVKTIIKFINVNPSLCYPLFEKLPSRQKCDSNFEDEFKRHRNITKNRLNDIYYDYMIDMFGNIYEGRPLSCQYEKEEENFMWEDHSSVITVGIPLCHKNNSSRWFKKTSNRKLAINELIRSLKSIGVLSENYTLEFPDKCKHTSLVKFMLNQHRGEISRMNFFDNLTDTDSIFR